MNEQLSKETDLFNQEPAVPTTTLAIHAVIYASIVVCANVYIHI